MFYTGIVEDVRDPLELGRARVRVIGIHSLDDTDIPTEALPWASILTPVTSASASGAGITPHFIPFVTWVLVYFFDGEDKQQPIIMGTIPGITNETVTYVVNGEQLTRNPSAVVSPNHLQSDLPRAARSGAVDSPTAGIRVENGDTSWEEPEDLRAFRQYPHNQVRQTSAGHFEEWDNTPGNERIRTQHSSGTFNEIRPDGTYHQKIEGDRYTVIAAGDNIYIEGVCNLHVNNDVNCFVNGDYNLSVKGDYNLKVKGNQYVEIGEDQIETIVGGTQKLIGQDHFMTVSGILDIGAGQDINITAGSATNVSAIGEVNVVSNSPISVSTKSTLTIGAEGDLSVSSEANTSVNSNGTLKITGTGATDIGSSSAMSIGSSSGVRLTGSTVNINDGGSSPSFDKAELNIDEIIKPEFEAQAVDFAIPVIMSVEPDLTTYSSQNGTLSGSQYKDYLQSNSKYYPYSPDNSYDNFNEHSTRIIEGPPANSFKATSGIGQLLEFIGKGEGSYDAANNGTSGNSIVGSTMNWTSNGRKLSQLTIQEIIDLQRGTRETGRQLFAVGRYQIIPATMRALAFPNSGLSLQDVFNETNQDILGITLLIKGQRRLLSNYLLGRSDDIFGAQMDFAREWASVPRPDTGRSYYGNGNRSAHSVEQVQTALRNAREEFIAQYSANQNELLAKNVVINMDGTAGRR